MTAVVSTSPTVYCTQCDQFIPRNAYLGHLRSNRHNTRSAASDEEVVVLKSAFKSRIVSYRISSKGHHINLGDFADEIKDKVLETVQRDVQKLGSIKLNVELFGLYFLESQNMHDIKSFNTQNRIVTVSSDLTDLYENFMSAIGAKMSDFSERNSGTIHVTIHEVNLKILCFQDGRCRTSCSLKSM